MPFCRGSSQPRDQTNISYVSCIGKRVLYHQPRLVEGMKPEGRAIRKNQTEKCHSSCRTGSSLFSPATWNRLFSPAVDKRFHIFQVVCLIISEVTQSRPTLCDPVDYSLPHSSVHGIFQARVLEWIAIAFSRASSRPRDQTQASHIGGRCFTI